MTVKAVIFDFGNTILRNVSFNPLAGIERLLELALPGHGLKPSDVQEFANAMDREIPRRKDELELIFEIPGLAFQRTLFETLGVSFSQDYEKLEQEFWSASMYYEPEDGILEVLHFLRDQGIRACVLSNSTFPGTLLENELYSHGLLEHFEFVLSSCDYGFRKPNPFFYNVALARLKLTPEFVCMVGDKVEFDVIGAYKAGIRPFWYNTGDHKDPRADDFIMLTHWNQFPSKLSKL